MSTTTALFSSSSDATAASAVLLNNNGISSNQKQPTDRNENDGLKLSDEKKNNNNNVPFVWTKQWYPILPLDSVHGLELESKPLAFELLGEKLVLWKQQQDEQFVVLQDTCPHRRAPLSTGKVVSKTTLEGEAMRTSSNSTSSSSFLACRYHGWEFDKGGMCTKIPMKTNACSMPQESRIRVSSYPVKQAGGLLWVYMDPDVSDDDEDDESSLVPDIPPQMLPPEPTDNNASWLVQVWPVSYQSLLENSFDPSHAPYIHEGAAVFGGLKYSPENAQPMKRYQLTIPLTATGGFALEHSPYMKPPPSFGGSSGGDHQGGKEEMMTTRRFVPPCLNVVSSPPAFGARLFFVPNSPYQTTTISKFEAFAPPPATTTTTLTKKQRISNAIHKLSTKLIPARCQESWSNWKHYFRLQLDSTVRFRQQDALTMQGQDERKYQDNLLREQQQQRQQQESQQEWQYQQNGMTAAAAPPPPGLLTSSADIVDPISMTRQEEVKPPSRVRNRPNRRQWHRHDGDYDLVASPSDAGVAATQRWMHKYGGGGPFATTAATTTTSGTAMASTMRAPPPPPPQGTVLSQWDAYAKYSPQCRAVLKQAAAWYQASRKWSQKSLIVALTSAVLHSVVVRAVRTSTSSAAGLAIFNHPALLLLSLFLQAVLPRLSTLSLVACVALRWTATYMGKVQHDLFTTNPHTQRTASTHNLLSNHLTESIYQY